MNHRTQLAGSRPIRAARPLLVRGAYALVLLLALAVALARLPEAIAQLAMPCAANCPDAALSPEGAREWIALGYTLGQFALLWAGVNAVFLALWVAISAVIVARRGGDWVALTIAIFLVTLGVGQFTSSVTEAVPHSPLWLGVERGLFVLGNVALALMFAVFPDGRFVPRWSAAFVVVYAVVEFTDQVLHPLYAALTASPLAEPLLYIPLYGAMLAAQVIRYRTISSPAQRQQTKWVLYGFAVFMAALFGVVVLPSVDPQIHAPGRLSGFLLEPVFLLGFSALPVSFGVAVLRYRLWDIDRLIGRTAVYGALTACVVGLYVLVVGYLGTLFRTEGNLAIALVATGLVAVLFQPLRERLQRGVNRLLYGERDDPYAVVASLGARLEAALAPEEALPALVETVAGALRLPYAAVLLEREGAVQLAASHGQLASAIQHFPLVYQGEGVGALLVAPRNAGEPFAPADERLLRVLAQQAGGVAHAVGLSLHLRQLTADLQRARAGLVAAREEERRRLRRDLHDGIGPTLASLAQRLDLARHLVGSDPAGADALLNELKGQVRATVADIRRLVYGLRPPALDELGLVGAIDEHVASMESWSGLRARVKAPARLPALPAAVEVAAYRIAVEALTNVARHAQASEWKLLITVEEGEPPALVVEVCDNGRGLGSGARAGVGMASMRERAAELGGRCEIGPSAAGGTAVRAWLPLNQEEHDAPDPRADR